MKKLLCILFACAALASCTKEWKFSEDMAVNSTRINIPQLSPQDPEDPDKQAIGFVISVFSGTDWKVTVTNGSDWLRPKEKKGEGIGHVHFYFDDNLDNPARIAKVQFKASSGKSVVVNVVQDGNSEKASSISDYLL